MVFFNYCWIISFLVTLVTLVTLHLKKKIIFFIFNLRSIYRKTTHQLKMFKSLAEHAETCILLIRATWYM